MRRSNLSRRPATAWEGLLQQSRATTSRRPTISPPARKRKAAEPPSSAPRTTQTYLDLGQKSFGRVVECRECGLAYTQGVEEDEDAHRKHHRRVMQGVRVRGMLADLHVVCWRLPTALHPFAVARLSFCAAAL
mmetsp:Transcript_11172/g.22572  ORF Transcript_11172/g.22572 Transcript_11172/m.22572 type:complete len:133 (-) Transcript_11172:770-1168(-)